MALLPAEVARAAAMPDIRAMLDASARAEPVAAPRMLAGFDADALPLTLRLDLQAARSGLAVDAELAAHFAFGRSGRFGRGPYRVTPIAGAWRAGKPAAAAIDADTAALAHDAAGGTVLLQPFLDRLIAALAETQVRLKGDVAAALEKQRALLAGQRAAVPLPGVGRLHDGGRYYTLLLRRQVGDVVDPVRAEARLRRELAALQHRADRLMASIGQHRGSVGARYTVLWQDPRWLYEDSAAGRTRAIADMNRMVAAAGGRVAAMV